MNFVWKERCQKGLRPDWVILLGVDLFIQDPDKASVIDSIIEAEREGAGRINARYAMVCYTGEARTGRLDDFGFLMVPEQYQNMQAIYTMIIKTNDVNAPDEIFGIDRLHASHSPLFSKELAMFNFGHSKSSEERDATLERRKKAWAEGLQSNYGSHYQPGASRNWIWNPHELQHYTESATYGKAFAKLLDQLYPDRKH
jgi:hypothetical protein